MPDSQKEKAREFFASIQEQLKSWRKALGLDEEDEAHEGSILVWRKTIRNRQVVRDARSEHRHPVTLFATTPAQVEVVRERKIGLPKYSSDTFGVSVRWPCYREEVPEAIADIEAFCEAKIKERIQKAGLSKRVEELERAIIQADNVDDDDFDEDD